MTDTLLSMGEATDVVNGSAFLIAIGVSVFMPLLVGLLKKLSIVGVTIEITHITFLLSIGLAYVVTRLTGESTALANLLTLATASFSVTTLSYQTTKWGGQMTKRFTGKYGGDK